MQSGETHRFTRRSVIGLVGAAAALPAASVSALDLEKRRMAFAPTFSDLVRNYTTTTGPGNFVLGAEVTGYRSFASAVKPGDNFYYSAIGVDKPSEFEVGRGIMQDDGTISRDPLTGAPTNFSGGYKTVALIAAAEWYETVQAGSALAPASAATRQELAALTDTTRPALLHEERREGIFTFDSSDHSAEVASDPRQAIYIAPSSEPGGASGAWVRQFEGPVMASWFGAVGNSATDDHASVQAALDFAGPFCRAVQVPAGTFLLSRSLTIPAGVVLQGTGNSSMFYSTNGGAGDPWIVRVSGSADIGIRNLTMVPGSAGDVYRSAIRLDGCSRATIENIFVSGQTNASGVYLFDCDDCHVEDLHFDGGAQYQGTGAYMVGCKGCKVTNSVAVNCYAGFAIAGVQTDPSTRTEAETSGNIIANCNVRNCASQAFDIISASYNCITNCHVENYVGTSTHKAFQSKDVSGDETRGNIFIGCTVENYPAGFGGQQSSHVQFIGCTGRDLATNGFELNTISDAQVVGCSIVGFGQTGIWLGSGTVRSHFDNITLETSTATATGILLTGAGNSTNNFDNITTASELAQFINIAPDSNNNRFGLGCRSNDNPIVDGSKTAIWPVVHTTPMVNLNSAATTGAAYMHRGMHVVSARWVTVGAVGGDPEVAIGRVGAATALGELQSVSGNSGSVTLLNLTTQLLTTGAVLSGTVGVTGTGTGFFQFEGLPRL
jgi:hypothetical protein